MAYDAVVESRRLILEGAPDTPFRLSRRRRFIPLAVDVDGDVAATLFVRRGVSGTPNLEAWALEKRDGEWVVLGGGGGGYDELFTPRATVDSDVLRLGEGWTLRAGHHLLPWPRRGISHAQMRLGPRVAELQIDRRRLAVAPHGVAIVVWGDRNQPTIRALDAAGEPLELVRPPRSHP